MAGIEDLKKELRNAASPTKAVILKRFFKTGPGQYGEGDIFLGVCVPEQRRIAGRYPRLTRGELLRLLKSPVHEERFTALILLISKYREAAPAEKKRLFDLYLSHTKWINNWDLVDVSAPSIVGAFLEGKNGRLLDRLAGSRSLWERRIAVVSTFYQIRRGKSGPTFRAVRKVLNDPHDLMHKAAGWMLREVGKHCGVETEERFLKRYFRKMPRTMLRYAIERFSPARRSFYLSRPVLDGGVRSAARRAATGASRPVLDGGVRSAAGQKAVS